MEMFDLESLAAEKPLWTQEQAISLCRAVEEVAPSADCHVALTGGCLYKDGLRKDCDLLFYSIRQSKGVDDTKPRVLEALARIPGFVVLTDYGWCVKAMYLERGVDMFFPELQLSGSGAYPDT